MTPKEMEKQVARAMYHDLHRKEIIEVVTEIHKLLKLRERTVIVHMSVRGQGQVGMYETRGKTQIGEKIIPLEDPSLNFPIGKTNMAGNETVGHIVIEILLSTAEEEMMNEP